MYKTWKISEIPQNSKITENFLTLSCKLPNFYIVVVHPCTWAAIPQKSTIERARTAAHF